MLKELIQVLLVQKISKITLAVIKSNFSSIKVIEANKGVYKGITHRTSNNEELNEYELLLCK
jgi:predicted acetyltransferase|tara:strand:+ start:2209 stop:2394 length:186 start_codon:yes stop_codon:yes gene_type:complete